MPRSPKDNYTGPSGQLAVMAELLQRLCNVAIPEVDVGEDLFAFRNGEETIARLQVKTATARPLKSAGAYTAQFSFPLKQLDLPEPPLLFYVLPVRLDDAWVDFLVLS